MKDYRVYLAQILERIGRVEEFTKDGKEAFLENRLIQDGVIRNFEVIGEAAKRIPSDFRIQQPNIPWRRISAFRDILIHAYDRVDLQEVWRIIEQELPPLKEAIRALLPPLDQLERELSGEEDLSERKTHK
jgi:uncharacterized protein with HEPN domain